MTLDLAIKITKNIYLFHAVGFEKNIIYNSSNRTLILTCAESGAFIKIVEKEEDMDFETFILIARNIWMNMLEFSQ